ncbi:hypothetical protein L917_15134 [Phytophthora nicotianae]|uniref:Uncharacterized protein n=1 Tax=Phytophthora nicotianae TaxID=4792 RepID=W2KLR0_PHYNI|nr:hypothetical protein L917_15134 [Phytophthora nicotianae]
MPDSPVITAPFPDGTHPRYYTEHLFRINTFVNRRAQHDCLSTTQRRSSSIQVQWLQLHLKCLMCSLLSTGTPPPLVRAVAFS